MQSIAQPCGVRVSASSRATSSKTNSRRCDAVNNVKMDKFAPKAFSFSSSSARESGSIRGSNTLKRDILKRERLSRRALKTKATGARYDSANLFFCSSSSFPNASRLVSMMIQTITTTDDDDILFLFFNAYAHT